MPKNYKPFKCYGGDLRIYIVGNRQKLIHLHGCQISNPKGQHNVLKRIEMDNPTVLLS